MADDITLNAGSGGDTIAADDILGVKYPRSKIVFGADGSAADVSAANPLPVVLKESVGTDIGDVVVANGIGASAVPIQDGGNSITVDDGASSLTVASEMNADVVTIVAKDQTDPPEWADFVLSIPTTQ